ncbi:MAG: VanZ family protein [Bacteroidaceae bacterium]|nr:VanZ family protein [Bacteroidaceae bacterium]
MITFHAKRYPLTLLVALAIILLSLIPVPEIKPLEGVSLLDKWAHMLMYGGLVCIIWWEYLRNHERLDTGRLFVCAFLAPILMGGMLELAQRYLTTCRSGEWLDFAANTTGVVLATLLGIAAAYLMKKRKG